MALKDVWAVALDDAGRGVLSAAANRIEAPEIVVRGVLRRRSGRGVWCGASRLGRQLGGQAGDDQVEAAVERAVGVGGE
ncbi:hypothetical protein GCM10009799_50910 [Nocardiopsis rhodophaea]|uniref:Uncharacterized protein n=1 Tax=Nocardiopsis rhodophaea TaxID=280238 RepID=A0ABP5F508_9ACTN